MGVQPILLPVTCLLSACYTANTNRCFFVVNTPFVACYLPVTLLLKFLYSTIITDVILSE